MNLEEKTHRFLKELPVLEAVKPRWYFVTALSLVVGIVLFATLHANQYQFALGGDNALSVLVDSPGTVVILNGNELGVTTAPHQKLQEFDLRDGPHQLQVVRTGHWPWGKTLPLSDGQSLTVHPFLLSENIPTIEIASTSEEYGEIVRLVNEEPIPTLGQARSSDDKTTATWLSGDGIHVTWRNEITEAPEYFCDPKCSPTRRVLEPTTPVRSLDFLPGRNDVLIVSLANGTFAFEADARGGQNMHPIFYGIVPRSLVIEDTLFVEDEGRLFTLSLSPR